MPPPRVPKPKPDSGERALLNAAEAGTIKKVRELIQNGINTNCKGSWQDRFHVTPLMFASEGGHLEVVRYLLEAGADVAASDSSKAMRGGRATALHYALKLYDDAQPNVAVVGALLKAGADPNARLANGDTALDFASGSGFVEGVELLLQYGGDPNATVGQDGRIALCQAASAGHLHIVRRLLEAGADPNGASDRGGTPLMAAAACSRADENGFSAKVYLEIMRALLAAGAMVDLGTRKGLTALMIACDEAACSVTQASFRSRLAAVRLLVEEGKADLNLKDGQGKTALDYASVSDYQELPEYLQKRGARAGRR